MKKTKTESESRGKQNVIVSQCELIAALHIVDLVWVNGIEFAESYQFGSMKCFPTHFIGSFPVGMHV